MEIVVEDFWKNKKVFLTGHTGFKGSWLSLWLINMGAQVTGYSLEPSTVPSLFNDLDISKEMNSIIGDIRDFNKLKDALLISKAEIVIHMAAQPLVRYSYEHPIETYSTNVMGTLNLFEAVKLSSSVRSIVNVTTDKCYENKEVLRGYKETDSLGGYDPYSNSKACSELVTSCYQQSFFGPKNKSQVNLASARAGNVIGGGDWSLDRLVPDIMRSIVENTPVNIRNPRAVRPWQHVLEPLCGYLKLAQKLYDSSEFISSYNFGPEESDAKEVEIVVDKLVKLWGDGASYGVQVDPNAKHEAGLLILDCTKSREFLNWTPKWNLESALLKIVEWNKDYFSGKRNVRETSLRQINEYLIAESEVK